MKFLGWMHRKMMQNNTEPMKYSIIGNLSSCFPVQISLDEQNYYKESIKTFSQACIKSQKSSKRFEANMEEMLSNEELLDEPFEFLAIGTFGIEPLNAGPPTPTLPAPFEKVTNQQIQTEVTANDLKLINYEIEKFLEAEEKGTMNDTSERNGQESIIIHSNKPTEGGSQAVACPLQKYLFATSIELAETETEIRKEKTSLGELFKRNDAANDPIMNSEEAELLMKKGKVARIMKKVMKKFHSSSSCPAASKNDNEVSLAIKKKLSKVIKMFHKKVYPEEMNDKKIIKLKKGKKNSSHEDDDWIGKEKENRKFPKSATKMSMKKLSSDGIHKGAPTEHGEHGHWIKTDSNYLVLEL
ncbi:protein LAZY 1-like isoform X2 [Henckelia pumila]|uniref:protein LAZY 1-like isoform X2 n=1 Tax=Henckelia pumila TaxID=405737 RepID=UPI003C6E1565